MSNRGGGRRLVIYAVCVLVVVAGVWAITLLLPPSGPEDQREALVEIEDVFGRVESTLPPSAIEQANELTTTRQCPDGQPGSQSTLVRRYELAEIERTEWREALETEFPGDDGWIMHFRRMGSSGGVNIRLTNLDLLTTQIYLVPEDTGQKLRLEADSRCYPTQAAHSE